MNAQLRESDPEKRKMLILKQRKAIVVDEVDFYGQLRKPLIGLVVTLIAIAALKKEILDRCGLLESTLLPEFVA